jgi:hypothetical protein
VTCEAWMSWIWLLWHTEKKTCAFNGCCISVEMGPLPDKGRSSCWVCHRDHVISTFKSLADVMTVLMRTWPICDVVGDQI